ncbi:MAG: SAM-dependent methyltransferase [Nitrosomonadaceae bacterium]|nr:SAM-dependent methyltransferase [Nitrosospira sp.]MDW7642814.1 SAM-dependent methyltransferase [Nitrosomonadaceae bacterium]MDW7653240.1 SAM-dependent methyltransferase [Nitrosomonadaceae bacterium]MDW7665617.1 SAM-dependent methyltransferase [Nitrosomonadaceae bacterium]
MSILPEPNEAASKHSQALQNTIRAEISVAAGWISFARYMELVLYAPGAGYYSNNIPKFGSTGDFVTAPEISSLFGRTIAQQVLQVFQYMDKGGNNILEFGAGTGKLALDLLLELERLGELPERYFILEVSAGLRRRQQELFARYLPHLISRIEWLEYLPTTFEGLMIANEVLDAMPIHLVMWHDKTLLERGVTWNNGAFQWSDRLLVAGELFNTARKVGCQINASNGYISEINLAANAFIKSLADILQRGAVLLIDYGFGHKEYYHPQRDKGTLVCHYRHYVHDDPFYLPGLQDITSHINFSAITEVTKGGQLELLGYTTLANFLINCGITKILEQTPVENSIDYLPLAGQLQRLVSPAEMGDLFKVIAFGRGIPQPMIGFIAGDKSHLL